MNKVSFVVLHFGDIKVTQKCIDSILQLDKQENISIVVVDNDYLKTSGEREELQRQYQEERNIEWVQIAEDIGFSKANNEGYRIAKEKYSPDYIVVTNNDIIFPQKDFIERVEMLYEVYPFEVLSPDVVSSDTGQHQSPIDVQGRSLRQVDYTIWMNRICLKLFPIMYPLLQRNYDRARNQNVNVALSERRDDVVPCGACLVVAGKFVTEEKMFVPETHFYYEEYILHERCRRAGYRVVFEPSVQVLHGDGLATKGKNKTEKQKLRFVMEETVKAAKIYKTLLQDKDQ
ncbi:MAG: glycosyltransferase family 2 protein [Lachnospiraceae bacterium]|nr:glycosyltransferase family 2 protein [Lachnospiraceae bacterium]